MKRLDSQVLVRPQSRELFFDTIILLCRKLYGLDWPDNYDSSWLRSFKSGKLRRIRQVYIEDGRIVLKSASIKQSQAPKSDSERREELFRRARQTLVDLIDNGKLYGQIEVRYNPIIKLDSGLVHLISSQMLTVCGTDYLRINIDGRESYGLVTFHKDAITKAFSQKNLVNNEERSPTDRDRAALRMLSKEMLDLIDKKFPASRRDRPTPNLTNWLDYKPQIESWLKSQNGGQSKRLSEAKYQKLIREIFEGGPLWSNAGRTAKVAKINAIIVFDHFFKKYKQNQIDDDEENA